MGSGVEFGEGDADVEGFEEGLRFPALVGGEHPFAFGHAAEDFDAGLVLGDEDVFFDGGELAIEFELAVVVVTFGGRGEDFEDYFGVGEAGVGVTGEDGLAADDEEVGVDVFGGGDADAG